MTTASQVKHDGRYQEYLDHGFVGLINHMGSDETIEFATRMSYGQGTRQVSDTRALLRYLVRHFHTSPIEMGEVVFHIKVPIAIMRQLVRHRTAKMNEYSARYSELTDEVYVPPVDRIQFQSTTNKQGSGEEMPMDQVVEILEVMECAYGDTDSAYRHLLDMGLSRETARMVMPVGGYTEVVWKCDLKNFFHMVKLRTDPHAQAEIRDLANIMYSMVRPLFPLICQAFEDYWRDGVHLSVFEYEALMDIISNAFDSTADLQATLAAALLTSAEQRNQALSKREITEFVTRFTPSI
ncbi:thymidylate synthase [Acidovorax phage ACP17]|uniref:Thymidylate synthase n=1 Tax=Acidovorax phage ACP17 TaxID=2010329 RepID=A0A218M388_9CAUD|nr:thymidylate synthase [Acidovorax phage ACP17]ASD50513.1 thymidylate synthase [Acidovorax phage ACP17]